MANPKLISHLHLAPWLRMSGALHPIEDTFTFYLSSMTVRDVQSLIFSTNERDTDKYEDNSENCYEV